MQGSLWQQCLVRLENELPEQQFNTWIRPLHAVESTKALKLLAPNRFVLDCVKDHYMNNIQDTVSHLSRDVALQVLLEIGSNQPAPMDTGNDAKKPRNTVSVDRRREKRELPRGNLNPGFTFNSFVEGKSNQLARAAGMQIGDNPGRVFNPLFIYGGVGIGKAVNGGFGLVLDGSEGVDRVICEEKHMGSRAVVILCRDEAAAAERFGLSGEGSGVIYTRTGQRFFDERWIDAELRLGKRTGAFCASTLPSLHPYVLLNYTGNLRDVMTVAHELGHVLGIDSHIPETVMADNAALPDAQEGMSAFLEKRAPEWKR